MGVNRQAIALLKGAYPNFRDEQIQAYGIMLNDIPEILQLEAVKNLLKTRKFLPAISEIREEASRLAHAITGDKVSSAETEWEVVLKAMCLVGIYQVPKFANPITARAVKAMGWRLLCGSDEVMMPTLRSQFVKTWRSLEEMEKTKKRMEKSMNGGLKQLAQQTLQWLERKTERTALPGRSDIHEI